MIPKIRNIPLGELLFELVDNYPIPKEELNDTKKHYMNIIKRNLKLLHENNRQKLLNTLFIKEQPKIILKQAITFSKIA